jgi:hypothetical protein
LHQHCEFGFSILSWRRSGWGLLWRSGWRCLSKKSNKLLSIENRIGGNGGEATSDLLSKYKSVNTESLAVCCSLKWLTSSCQTAHCLGHLLWSTTLGCWDGFLSGQSFVTLEDHLGAALQKTRFSFLIFLQLVVFVYSCLYRIIIMSVMVRLCF